MGIFSSEIDSLVDEATSEYLPAAQADISKNLEICDMIKSRQVGAREAMKTIKRRLQNKNPNVQILALELTDATIKNTSYSFFKEIASREFVDVLVELCKSPIDSVAERAREKFQTWTILVGGQEGLGYLKEAYEQTKREGTRFPPPPTNLPKAIVNTETPPEWTNSANCERCKVMFSIIVRKHHCRRCGKTYCQDCSSKVISLPELGLYEEVRVCESCFARKFAEKSHIRNSTSEKPLPTVNDYEDDERDCFEDDLAKAIRLSIQESSPAVIKSESKPPNSCQEESYDEEAALAAAIAESLRETAVATTRLREEVPTCPPMPSSSMAISPPTAAASSQPSITLLITPIERENIQLFSELVSRMNPHDEELEEPEFLKLARDMITLRERLQRAASSDDSIVDLQRVLTMLDAALLQYERVATGDTSAEPVYGVSLPPDLSDLAAIPTRPRSHTGSIMYIDPSRRLHINPPPVRPNLQPISVTIAPVLQPIKSGHVPNDPTDSDRNEPVLIPSLANDDDDPPYEDDAAKGQEDSLAELVDDVPLIQL